MYKSNLRICQNRFFSHHDKTSLRHRARVRVPLFLLGGLFDKRVQVFTFLQILSKTDGRRKLKFSHNVH